MTQRPTPDMGAVYLASTGMANAAHTVLPSAK
jgi:hypothetical protein